MSYTNYDTTTAYYYTYNPGNEMCQCGHDKRHHYQHTEHCFNHNFESFENGKPFQCDCEKFEGVEKEE